MRANFLFLTALLFFNDNSTAIALEDHMVSLDFVLVEAGSYIKGERSEPTAYSVEYLRNSRLIPHQVTISKSFLIGKYEVTVEQFFEIFNYGIERGKLKTREELPLGSGLRITLVEENLFLFGRPLFRLPFNAYGFDEYVFLENGKLVFNNPRSARKPIVGVTWYGAIWFCNLLSEIEGRESYYLIEWNNIRLSGKKGGYRLATEAEWEWAARGGGRSKNYQYAGTNELLETGYDRQHSQHEPTEVGKFVANELGIFDFSGNAEEWVWDYFAAETEVATLDPVGPAEGHERVTKGGGWWDSSPEMLLPVSRGWRLPSSNVDGRGGIRVVKDLP